MPSTFGEALERAISKAGATQNGFGQAAGVSSSTISKWTKLPRFTGSAKQQLLAGVRYLCDISTEPLSKEILAMANAGAAHLRGLADDKGRKPRPAPPTRTTSAVADVRELVGELIEDYGAPVVYAFLVSTRVTLDQLRVIDRMRETADASDSSLTPAPPGTVWGPGTEIGDRIVRELHAAGPPKSKPSSKRQRKTG